MMQEASGSWQRLSLNRALVVDSVHYARRVPLFPVERSLDLSRLAEVRATARPRISWTVLFMKAYALVAQEMPPLRQAFFPWPWARLYQHPHSVAMIAIQRQFQGEDRLCWGRFLAPEHQSLTDLQAALERYQQEPVEKAFRRQVRLSRFPGPLRGLAWRLSLDLSGGKRAKRLGTFSLSSLAGQGCLNRFHPTFLTSSLTYGPLDSQGHSLVTLICDHRVLDGVPAAKALARLGEVLQGVIADELSRGAADRRAA